MSRKVVLYISMSVDGFLATKDDDLSWLSIVEKEGEDYGYHHFTNSVDAYIVGKKTYDVILNLTGGTFPQSETMDCYVITREEKKRENGVTFYNGKLSDLVQELKSKKGKNIYCDGGATLVKMLRDENLIDEYIVSIIPIFLGDGIKLFKESTQGSKLTLITSKHYESGLVQVHYKKE